MDDKRRKRLAEKYKNAPQNIKAFVLGSGLPRQGQITNQEQLRKTVMETVKWLNGENTDHGT